MSILHKKSINSLSVTATLVASLISLSAQAQTDADRQESTASVLEEITVTARRVEENPQDVPISISALSAETLERRQILNTVDLGKVSPNLEFANNAPLAANNASSMVFIRGIGQISPLSNVDPGVGLYIDEVYVGQSVGGSMELRDIANVQVLRGPQGTLFGRNTVGGAVLLTTTEPGDTFGGKVRGHTGSDGLLELFGGVDLPVAEQLKIRLSYGLKQQDGYATRRDDGIDLGDSNNSTFMARLVLTPSERLRLKLSLDLADADENGAPLVFAAYGNNPNPDPSTWNPAAHFGVLRSVEAGCPEAAFAVPPPRGWTGENDDPRCVNNQWHAGPFQNNGTAPVASTLSNSGVSLHLTYDLNETMTFKTIVAARDLEWTGDRDADNTPFTILHTDYDSDGSQSSYELQWLYATDRLRGVVGLFGYEEEISDRLAVGLGNSDVLTINKNVVSNSNFALFTQWTYAFDERFGATLGLRNTEETKGSTPDQFSQEDPDLKYLEVRLYEQDFSATTATLSGNYRWSDALMTYASYSEGFKSGGWNATFSLVQTPERLAAFHRFAEENAETVELGFKADLNARTMRLNGAIFTTDYSDLQFIFRVGPAPYLLNAGAASIDGMELEWSWLPSESMIIEAALGQLHASIDSITTNFVALGLGATTAVTTDNTLPYTPDLTYNIGIGYTFNTARLAISIRGDLSYRSETFFDTANTEIIAQTEPMTLFDAKVVVGPPEGSWSASFGLINLTDEEYPVAGNSSLTTGSGYAEITYARPLQFRAGLTYSF